MKKQTFVYPGSDLDRSRAMIAALGTFWSRIYTAKDQLQAYTESVAALAAQNYQNLLELVWSISRFDVPIFHKQFWVPIIIKKSELTRRRVVNNFFDGTGSRFDLTQAGLDGVIDRDLFYFSTPTNLVAVGQIFNQMLYPTIALIENVDYIIDQKSKAVAFVVNPFDSPGFLKRATVTDDQPDEEVILWGFNGSFDYEYVFNQFAYALGIRLKSSQGFKDLVNAIISGLLSGGATCSDLDLALSAICGIPLTTNPQETVTLIDLDNRGRVIVTDKNVYRFSPTAEPVVQVGQTLRAGSQLVRGFDIDEFFVGTTYDPLLKNSDGICCPTPGTFLTSNTFEDLLTEDTTADIMVNLGDNCSPARKTLRALALDGGFLSACFYGDLIFENKEVPLVVDTNHPTGFTYVSFAVGGLPQDTKQFFDEVHCRGICAAQSTEPCATGAINIKGTTISWPPEANPLPENVWIIGDVVPTGAPPGTEPGYAFIRSNGVWKNVGRLRDFLANRQPTPTRHTLAHYLDRRRNPLSEPNSSHLPATINPLRFIVENALRNNVFVVKLTVAALGQNRLGLYNIRHLRQLLPPGTAMLLVFDIDVAADRVKGDRAVNENTGLFIGAEPATDVIDDTLISDLGVTARLISGSCQ